MNSQLAPPGNHYSSKPSVFSVHQGDGYRGYSIVTSLIWNTSYIAGTARCADGTLNFTQTNKLFTSPLYPYLSVHIIHVTLSLYSLHHYTLISLSHHPYNLISLFTSPLYPYHSIHITLIPLSLYSHHPYTLISLFTSPI